MIKLFINIYNKFLKEVDTLIIRVIKPYGLKKNDLWKLYSNVVSKPLIKMKNEK